MSVKQLMADMDATHTFVVAAQGHVWRMTLAFRAEQIDGLWIEHPRRPLALLHANPDRTAWVRLRHFEAAVEHIGKRHADVLFGSDEALSLNVFGDHLDACYEAAEGVRR